MVFGILMIIIFLPEVCRKPGGDVVPKSHMNSLKKKKLVNAKNEGYIILRKHGAEGRT